MIDWRIVIPTRDSSRYIGTFLAHYRKNGIEPLYIVDGRSADTTEDILKNCGAEFYKTHPSDSFGVTELLQEACLRSASKWVIRMDDDEFPSAGMMEYIENTSKTSTNQTYAFSREWVILRDGRPTLYRVSRLTFGEIYDPQHRMFLNEHLEFDHQIHTVGIVLDRPQVYAPNNCFMIHYDSMIKSKEEQLAKVRRYELIEQGSAFRFCDLYLPHLYKDSNFIFHDVGFEEFSEVTNSIALPATKDISLSRAERKLAAELCPSELKTTNFFRGFEATYWTSAQQIGAGRASQCKARPWTERHIGRPDRRRTQNSCRIPGERVGVRTRDPLIKSQMLYRLSYALSGCGRIRRNEVAKQVGPPDIPPRPPPIAQARPMKRCLSSLNPAALGARTYPMTRNTITITTKATIATSVVTPAFMRRRGATGAPGSEPGTTSPASACDRTPIGNTANRTVNQIVRKTATARAKGIGSVNMI